MMTGSFVKPRVALLGVALLALGGCATVQRSATQVNAARQRAEQRLRTQIARGTPAVVHSRDPLLVGARIAVTDSSLPGFFSRPVTLVTGSPWTLTQISGRLAQITGLPVRVAYSAQTAQMQSATMGGLGAPPMGAGTSLPPTMGLGSGTQMSMRVDWSGPLKGLLDLVASRSGVYWHYRHGAITFFLTESKTFRIPLLPGQNTYSAKVTNQGSAGGGGAGSSKTGSQTQTSQTVSTSATLDSYAGITQGIKTLLAQVKAAQSSGGTGGMSAAQPPTTAVFADPSSGTITVTATPPLLRVVSRYLRAVAHHMTRQVLVSVHVYSVSLDNSETNGLNLTAAFNRIEGGALNIVGATPPGTPAGASGATGALVVSPTSPWNGTQMLAQALATQGNVSLVTSAQVLALDNQPAPLQVGNQVSYLASSSTTTTTSVGATTSLTPGQITVGFSANFLPMIVDGNHVLLGYSINLSQLLSLQTVTSGGSSIQTPNVATQSIMQRAMLKSGQTLVLSGFEQTGAEVNRTGTGRPGFWELGGGVGATQNHSVLVIAIGVRVL